MTIQQAQTDIDTWIKTIGVTYFNELTNLGILMEEVGELSRIMVRKYGDQSFKESDKKNDLPDELADVLWVLLTIANQTGVNVTEALQNNFVCSQAFVPSARFTNINVGLPVLPIP